MTDRKIRLRELLKQEVDNFMDECGSDVGGGKKTLAFYVSWSRSDGGDDRVWNAHKKVTTVDEL